MTSPVLGPLYRQMADVMKNTATQIAKEVEKLRRTIRGRLAGKPKLRDKFEKEWDKAKDTKGRRRAAAVALGRVIGEIDELGETVSAELANAETELWALIDLLRALEQIEGLQKHFEDLAKAYGY